MKGRGEVSGGGSLCPQAGKQQQGAGHGGPEGGEVAGVGGPHDRADAGVLALRFLGPQPRHLRRHPLAEAAALEVGLPRIARLDEDEDGPAVGPRRLHKGRERLEAQKRIDREGIPRVAPRQPALGVGLGSRANIAPLTVEEHGQAQGAAQGADFLQQAETGQPQRLKKGELRLDASGIGGGRLQHVQGVRPQVREVAVEVGAGVQADAQPRSQAAGAVGDEGGEGGRHRERRYQLPAARRQPGLPPPLACGQDGNLRPCSRLW